MIGRRGSISLLLTLLYSSNLGIGQIWFGKGDQLMGGLLGGCFAAFFGADIMSVDYL